MSPETKNVKKGGSSSLYTNLSLPSFKETSPGVWEWQCSWYRGPGLSPWWSAGCGFAAAATLYGATALLASSGSSSIGWWAAASAAMAWVCVGVHWLLCRGASPLGFVFDNNTRTFGWKPGKSFPYADISFILVHCAGDSYGIGLKVGREVFDLTGPCTSRFQASNTVHLLTGQLEYRMTHHTISTANQSSPATEGLSCASNVPLAETA